MTPNRRRSADGRTRVGVIGSGSMGRNHERVYSTIVLVADHEAALIDDVPVVGVPRHPVEGHAQWRVTPASQSPFQDGPVQRCVAATPRQQRRVDVDATEAAVCSSCAPTNRFQNRLTMRSAHHSAKRAG